MNNMIQRDYSFDYLKGILIFLVVLGHCPAFLLTPQGAEFDRWSDPMFVFIYSFHMPLFMLTTGFFFSKKKNSTLRELLPKQIKRLILPQLSWCLVCLVIIAIQFNRFGSFIVGSSMTETIKLIYHFLTSYWYLWCTLFCGVIVVLANKCRFPLLVLSVFCVLMLIFEKYLPDWFFKHQQVINQLPFFTLGVYLHDVENLDYKIRKLFPFSVLGYIACWCVYMNYYDSFGNISSVFKMIWALFGVMLFYTIIKEMFNKRFFDNTITKLGGYTLGIYIIHSVLNRYLVQGNLGIYVHTKSLIIDYLISFIYSILLTWVCVWIINLIRKNKILRTYLLGEK